MVGKHLKWSIYSQIAVRHSDSTVVLHSDLLDVRFRRCMTQMHWLPLDNSGNFSHEIDIALISATKKVDELVFDSHRKYDCTLTNC